MTSYYLAHRSYKKEKLYAPFLNDLRLRYGDGGQRFADQLREPFALQ